MSPHSGSIRREEPHPDWQKWWCSKGWKMSPNLDLARRTLLIQNGDTAKLTIYPLAFPESSWSVDWFIAHQRGRVEGHVLMNDVELQLAFGITTGLMKPSSLALQYNADVAIQGRFIRQHRYLNIPHPGTLLHGDPNISVYVSREVQDSVSKLIRSVRGA